MPAAVSAVRRVEFVFMDVIIQQRLRSFRGAEKTSAYSGHMPGRLYVVSTPIGNLEDITYRAVRLLGEVAWIACEDTRHTRRLLDHYGIHTPMVS